jgi:hypothetical protein
MGIKSSLAGRKQDSLKSQAFAMKYRISQYEI